ncbi:MAG: MOSC domain-containing protein [Pseudomonadota bacterium]
MPETLKDLISRVTKPGQVIWIGLRPARREAMVEVDKAAITEAGLEGDRSRTGKRAVTLIQAEHLPVIASFIGQDGIKPAYLRRNIVVSGINLLALKGRQVQLGSAVIEITGPCAPCSRMEEVLGFGGYSAMRGHGGVTASVIIPGKVSIGDAVTTLEGSHP